MTRYRFSRLTVGLVIILIGVILLLSTTGLVEMRSVWGWIALLFVIVGMWGLISSGFQNIVGPVMIIAIAGTFFLRNVGLIEDGIIGMWWPLFVVLFGVLVMINRSRRRRRFRTAGTDIASEVSVVSVFGSDDRRIATDAFTSAEVVTVFGDGLLDLRDSAIQSPPAIVEATSVFGDAEIRVPIDWTVHLETMSVFGETIDRRPRSESVVPSDGEPDLIVTGIALFGEIEIRD